MWPFGNQVDNYYNEQEKEERFFKELRSSFLELSSELESVYLRYLNGDDEVDKNLVLSIPAVSTCLEFIANGVANAPIRLYERTKNGVEEIADDYRLQLINGDTGDLLDSVQWKKALVYDYFLHGSCYSYMDFNGNRLQSIRYVDKRNVSVILNEDPVFKRAEFRINGIEFPEYRIMRMTRDSVDGVRGTGIMTANRIILQVMKNSLLLENKNAKSGGKKGFLTSDKQLSDEAMERVRKLWKEVYNSEEPSAFVLNKGMGFEEATATSVELQMNENKETNSAEIAKLFNLPPNPLDDYVKSMKMGVIPVLNNFAQALNKFALLEHEKKNLFFEADIDELLQPEIKERYAAYEIGIKNGFLQVEDVRNKENLQSLGLEFTKLGLQDVLYFPDKDTIYTPNTNKLAKLGGGGEIDEG